MLPLQLCHLQIMFAEEMTFILLKISKKIPASPGKEEVVLIGNTPVKRYQIECLFHSNAQVHDEVITS